MKNENMKCNAVIRVCNNNKGITVERGFIDVGKAKDAYLFLDCVCDKAEIFYRLDWFAGEDMPGFDGEYWFGKRSEKREAYDAELAYYTELCNGDKKLGYRTMYDVEYCKRMGF